MTRSPAIREVMKKVRVEESDLTGEQAEISVQLRQGQTLKHRVEHALGDPGNPLSDRDVEEKARTLLSPLLPKRRIDALLKKLWAFESVGNVGEVIRLLSKKKSHSCGKP
jgi:2-methylcitrate dehydratase PrpD